MKAARTLCQALGESSRSGRPCLASRPARSQLEIRLAAAKGLWNVAHGDAVVPALITLLEENRSPTPPTAESARQFLLTVIEALWRIGPPAIAAQAALQAKTKDRTA